MLVKYNHRTLNKPHIFKYNSYVFDAMVSLHSANVPVATKPAQFFLLEGGLRTVLCGGGGFRAQ